MTSVSRPLIGLLLATVAFFAVWTLALKPHSGSGGGANSPSTYQSAIDKAHQAVATSDAASKAHGGTIVTTPTTPATATAPAPSATGSAASTATTATTGTQAPAKSATAAHAATKSTTPVPTGQVLRTAAERRAAVNKALRAHKVVAILFFNPRAADDKMNHAELAKIPGHNGQVFKLSVPLVELNNYPVVTQQVQLNMSPTIVIVDRAHRASTILGFSDTFEITRRVDTALAVQPQ